MGGQLGITPVVFVAQNHIHELCLPCFVLDHIWSLHIRS